MKNLLPLAAALLLASLPSRAATPPPVIPIPGGAVTPTLSVKGSTITLFGATTNVSLYVTNYAVTRPLDNTNQIVVYSVGDVPSRGTYVFSQTLNGVGQFTNTLANGKTLAWDKESLDFGIDFQFAITNGSAGGGDASVRYGTTGTPLLLPALLPQTISAQNGATAPGGIITWGTNYVTNFFQEVVCTPIALPQPFQPGKLFVSTNGSDISALRGRSDYPFGSIAAAFTNSVAGDTIIIGQGTFTNDTDLYNLSVSQLPANVTVRGEGRGRTFVNGRINNSVWHLGNSNIIADMTLTNVWLYDGTLAVVTNLEFRNLQATAQGDVIVFQQGTMNAHIWNCDLGGNSDKIADLTSLANPAIAYLTNSILTIENTRITGGPGAADGIPDGLNATGLMTWRGGGIHVDVDGGEFEEHILTNGIVGWKGPGSYIFAPQQGRTNWIGGQLYTNWSSGSWEVKGVSVLTEAAVVGGAVQQLWVYNKSMAGGGLGTTNQHARQTTAATSAGTNAITLSAWIPPGYVFAFTNLSGGAGNSAIVKDGQYLIP